MSYTVVIPTMWMFAPFTAFLKDLVEESSVSMINIINNDVDRTPDDPILKHKKILMYNMPDNIGVNPAWNFGVQYSGGNENICIMNDDITFDLKVFKKLYGRLRKGSGVYGLCPGDPIHYQPPVTTGIIEFQHTPFPYHYSKHFGFGQLMFLNKHDWTPIPNGLKIYWGDNFIYDTYYHKFNNNHVITNMFFHTPCATTTSTIENPGGIVQQEGIIFNQVMPQIVNDILASKQ